MALAAVSRVQTARERRFCQSWTNSLTQGNANIASNLVLRNVQKWFELDWILYIWAVLAFKLLAIITNYASVLIKFKVHVGQLHVSTYFFRLLALKFKSICLILSLRFRHNLQPCLTRPQLVWSVVVCQGWLVRSECRASCHHEVVGTGHLAHSTGPGPGPHRGPGALQLHPGVHEGLHPPPQGVWAGDTIARTTMRRIFVIWSIMEIPDGSI